MALNRQCGPFEGATRQTQSRPSEHTETFSAKDKKNKPTAIVDLVVIEHGITLDQLPPQLRVFARKYFRSENAAHVAHRPTIKVAEQQRSQQQSEAAPLTTMLWNEAIDNTVSGYLTKNGRSSSLDTRWHERLDCCQVLVTDVSGTIFTVKKIYNIPAPNKFYLKGGPTAGCMVGIGSLVTAGRLLISERFASGALRKNSGETVTCALATGNMLAVCKALLVQYPQAEIVVASDGDPEKGGNSGRTKATEAAVAIKANLAMPELCDGCNCTDFNDSANFERGASR